MKTGANSSTEPSTVNVISVFPQVNVGKIWHTKKIKQSHLHPKGVTPLFPSLERPINAVDSLPDSKKLHGTRSDGISCRGSDYEMHVFLVGPRQA